MLITVPCFTSGRDVILSGELPPKKTSRPQRITKKSARWDRTDDALLTHWRQVRKLSVAEVVSRCDWNQTTVRKQLVRLGLYDVKSVAWVTLWDRYIYEGLSDADVMELTGVSRSTVTKRKQVLNCVRVRVEWTRVHTRRMNKLLREGNSKSETARIMGVDRKTITRRSGK